MAPRLAYTEHLPPPDLAPWVACFWRIRGAVDGGAPYFHRVLPDGCADLIWRRGELRLAGPDSEAFASPVAPAERVTGIRFRPGWAPGGSGRGLDR